MGGVKFECYVVCRRRISFCYDLVREPFCSWEEAILDLFCCCCRIGGISRILPGASVLSTFFADPFFRLSG